MSSVITNVDFFFANQNDHKCLYVKLINVVETYDDAICMIINGEINVFQKLVNVKFPPPCPLIFLEGCVNDQLN